MRRTIGTLIAIASLYSAAFAADLPAKAPAVPVQPFATGSPGGWYVGVNTEAAVASSSVSGTNFPSLTGANFTAAGAAVGVDIGYIWNNCIGGSWCQVEFGANWQNISGAVSVGSAQSTWSLTQEADIGLQVFQTIIAVLPGLNASFPTFNPSGLLPADIAVATTPRQYVGFKLQEFDLGGSFGSATGQSVAVAPGIDTGYRWQTLGTNGSPNGGSLNIQAFIVWPTKGVSLSDVFAAGHPITIGAAVQESTIYGAKLQYDFGIPSH